MRNIPAKRPHRHPLAGRCANGDCAPGYLSLSRISPVPSFPRPCKNGSAIRDCSPRRARPKKGRHLDAMRLLASRMSKVVGLWTALMCMLPSKTNSKSKDCVLAIAFRANRNKRLHFGRRPYTIRLRARSMLARPNFRAPVCLLDCAGNTQSRGQPIETRTASV